MEDVDAARRANPTTGASTVGPESVHDVDCSEPFLLRHKRTTSGYCTETLNWSLAEIDSEIKKLQVESAGIERRLTSMSGADPMSCASTDDAEARGPSQYVTTRGVRRHHECSSTDTSLPAVALAPRCSGGDASTVRLPMTAGRLQSPGRRQSLSSSAFAEFVIMILFVINRLFFAVLVVSLTMLLQFDNLHVFVILEDVIRLLVRQLFQ